MMRRLTVLLTAVFALLTVSCNNKSDETDPAQTLSGSLFRISPLPSMILAPAPLILQATKESRPSPLHSMTQQETPHTATPSYVAMLPHIPILVSSV